jgi:hypothetical protein
MDNGENDEVEDDEDENERMAWEKNIKKLNKYL